MRNTLKRPHRATLWQEVERGYAFFMEQKGRFDAMNQKICTSHPATRKLPPDEKCPLFYRRSIPTV